MLQRTTSIMYKYQMHFSCTFASSARPAAGLCCPLGYGRRRGSACTLRRQLWPRPDSVAGVLGFKVARVGSFATGLLSAELEPTRRMAAPKYKYTFQKQVCALLLCTYQYLLQVPHQRQQREGNIQHIQQTHLGWVAQPRSRASARKCNFQLTAQLTAD